MTTRNIGEEGFRWFIGSVESLDDPLNLGRVRVRVIGEHDDSIETEFLPFAQLMSPITSASVGGIGVSPTGILIGSRVIGFFIDGNEKQIPMIMGTYHTYSEESESGHGVNPLARGTNYVEKTSIGPEPSSSYNSKYPFNKVTSTQSGHIIEIDDTPEHERIHVYHKSGSYSEISSNGKRVTKIVDEDFEIIVKEKTLFVRGNISIVSENGKITLSSKEDVKIKSDSVVKIESKTAEINCDSVKVESDTASIKSETVNIDSSKTNINSAFINLTSATSINLTSPVINVKGALKTS